MDPDEAGEPLNFESHKPLRSILKQSAPRPIPSRFTAHAPSGSRIRIHDQPHPNHPLRDVSELPNAGPTPAFYLPAMDDVEQLEAFTFQIAAQLRVRRLAQEEARRKEEENRPPPLPRPTGKPDEFPEFSVILMGKWVPGPDLGPVLHPSFAKSLGPITLNPLLASPFSDQRRLHWDIRFYFEDAKYVTPQREIPLSIPNAHLQPATAPRIPRLSIISRSFSWSMQVNARIAPAGVTVYDVLDTICRILQMVLADRDLRNTNASHRSAIISAAEARASQSIGPPGIRVFDWLTKATQFGGLVHDPDHVETSFLRPDEAFFVLSFDVP
ncbi:hypothetical protein BDZ89DRAFT_1074860 [Hymenopellis radicata]|nr:hypothetical protein BDZ89DRAFT_1074860 [Hymenopellis radicata]